MSTSKFTAITSTALLAFLAACAPLRGGGEPSLLSSAPQEAGEPAPDASDVLATYETSLREIAERAAPSIVTIAAYERVEGSQETAVDASAWMRRIDHDYPGFRLIGSGSGIVLNAEGDLLTNRHFLLKKDGEPADLVDVETVDNRHTIARVVGLEPTLNIGVLSLEVYSRDNPPRFEPIAWGDSARLLPGHLAIAAGDPFGPEKYFGVGTLASSPNRECYQEQLTATFLQIALQVHPGTYGGPLLDSRGELVGMLTPRDPAFDSEASGATVVPLGVEFALPSNILRGLVQTIKRNEMRRSPWLGYAVMSIAELRNQLGGPEFAKLSRPLQGIFVENVFEPSPAFAAGIRPGDWLTHFNGVVLGSPLDFQRELYLAGIGGTVEARIFRDGETRSIDLVIEERPENAITR